MIANKPSYKYIEAFIIFILVLMEIEPTPSSTETKVIDLPTRNKGSYMDKYTKCNLDTNYYPVKLTNI